MSKIQTNTIQHTANGAAVFTLPTADGTNGQVLKTNGSGTLSFGADQGKILQVVQVTHTAEVSTTGITYVDTGLSASITPSSSSSKILVMVTQRFFIQRSTDQARGGFRLLRGSSVIMQGPNTQNGQEPGGEGQSTNLGGSTQVAGAFNCTFLDSPSTTSSTTYKTQFANNQSSASPTIFVNSLNNNSGEDGVSTMTLMEVAV
jgi:hypothetical protein|tara:strand:- start:216 stop:824 length:609 start_codon:yes stop_codon:yes gene_type:complete